MNTWPRSPTGLALIAFLAIAAFYFVTEHNVHFFGILPYALLLLCPLLHLFMHGGHGSHAGHEERPPTQGSHAGHDTSLSTHTESQARQSQGGQR
jgi:hypothetical protein